MMANRSMRVYCYVLVAIFVFFLPAAVYAQSEISVDVEMDEYSLGDHIVFTLSVPDILDNEFASLTISHSLQNVNSVEIPVPNMTSTYTSPDPLIHFICQVFGWCKLEFLQMFLHSVNYARL